MIRTMWIALTVAVGTGCTIGGEDPVCSTDFVVDGQFGSMDDPECAEWRDVAPQVGRFGDLYVGVDAASNLVVLNDWHLRGDAPAEREMYNLFCLATDVGMFEVRVFGDQHVEAWLDGEQIDERVEGASGFGPSPSNPSSHTIFEFVLAELPGSLRVLECDPAGGPMVAPATPPGVRLASESGCFANSGPGVPHNLVREPNIFEFELGPDGVRRATTSLAPLLLGTSAGTIEAGAQVTIYGAQLGTEGTVRVDGIVAETTAWTDSSLTVRLPPTLVGELDLEVTVDGVASNVLHLRVEAPDCSPACAAGFECDASGTCVPIVLD